MNTARASKWLSGHVSPLPCALRGWMTVVGGAIAVGVVYFLTARLGLALLASPSDVAVFWPAAGVAAGILITLGRRALPALLIGVVAATVAANMLSDRSLLTALLKGFCNAGEPVLAAWLLKRWVGEPFSLGSLRRVLGFLAAATLATAASAVAGAIVMTSLHTAAPFSSVWLAWFLSDGLGIVIVAPLLIACGELRFNLPSRNELVEGVGVLALLALTAVYVRSQSSASWVSVNPGVFTLPLLLWLAARCPPIFPIAGAFAISLSAIFAVTFGTGRLGDASVPLLARVYGVQGTVVMVTAYTLVLIALFAERRRSELELDHRVKNTLACVAAIAEQTRATSNSMDEFLEVLRGRIRSLANTHARLSLNRWRGVDLAELVRGELAPCVRDGNTLVDGPAVDVTADSVQTVAIVLHELTTNAAKYGALSNDSGRISVRGTGSRMETHVMAWSLSGVRLEDHPSRFPRLQDMGPA